MGVSAAVFLGDIVVMHEARVFSEVERLAERRVAALAPEVSQPLVHRVDVVDQVAPAAEPRHAISPRTLEGALLVVNYSHVPREVVRLAEQGRAAGDGALVGALWDRC